jgi:hypothetical protein
MEPRSGGEALFGVTDADIAWPQPASGATLSTHVSLRQCAWCWLVQDSTGSYRIQPARKIRSATHGICPDCKETMRAEIEGRSTVLARAG